PTSTLFPYTTLFRSRCAPAEAERIEGKGCDLDVRVVLHETIQSDLDLAKCVIHPRGDACLATPKPCAKKTVFPSRLSPDAFDVRSEEHTSELQSREN